MLLIPTFLQNLRRFSFLAARFKYLATPFRADFWEGPRGEYDILERVCRKGVWAHRGHSV
jgi:hypothetical protein